MVLSSSEPNSLVYIETAELDGETNLKVRQPIPETSHLHNDENKLAEFNGNLLLHRKCIMCKLGYINKRAEGNAYVYLSANATTDRSPCPHMHS